MLKKNCSIVFALIIVLGGCVPSLHELYTADTLLFDEKLVGCWGDADEMWCFTRSGQEKKYDLIITEKEQKRSFLQAHLTEVGGRRFLDLYPQEKTELGLQQQD